ESTSTAPRGRSRHRGRSVSRTSLSSSDRSFVSSSSTSHASTSSWRSGNWRRGGRSRGSRPGQTPGRGGRGSGGRGGRARDDIASVSSFASRRTQDIPLLLTEHGNNRRIEHRITMDELRNCIKYGIRQDQSWRVYKSEHDNI